MKSNDFTCTLVSKTWILKFDALNDNFLYESRDINIVFHYFVDSIVRLRKTIFCIENDCVPKYFDHILKPFHKLLIFVSSKWYTQGFALNEQIWVKNEKCSKFSILFEIICLFKNLLFLNPFWVFKLIFIGFGGKIVGIVQKLIFSNCICNAISLKISYNCLFCPIRLRILWFIFYHIDFPSLKITAFVVFSQISHRICELLMHLLSLSINICSKNETKAQPNAIWNLYSHRSDSCDRSIEIKWRFEHKYMCISPW